MKKVLSVLAFAAIATQAMHAQTVVESLTFDNWYVGLNAGGNVTASSFNLSKDLNAQFGIRIGRWITPVVGFAVEGQAYVGGRGHFKLSHTVVNTVGASLLGTINFSNWFGRYPGTPRTFEVIGLAGIGAGHICGGVSQYNEFAPNNMTSKFGIDLAFNFGSDKQWQAYIEPALLYELANGYTKIQYNINRAFFTTSVGVSYKFMTSNGTHNFKLAECDACNYDELNAQIDALRNESNKKDGQINDLKKALDDCLNKPVPPVVKKSCLLPIILFRQNRSEIDRSQYVAIDQIATYLKENPDAKIEIKGYASVEGRKDRNQKLSIVRAENVKAMLVQKYNIAASRLKAVGCGATDHFSDKIEFNRVATFEENNK